jgi:outer membrane protein OmpA-like peptidoglycan-associated protein
MKLSAIVFVFISVYSLSAIEPALVSSAELAKKWKRTKSLTAPVEKLRKGLSVELDGHANATLEVKVDADTACSFQNIQFKLDIAVLDGAATFAQLAEIATAMKAAGTETFVIEGHTCDLGVESHNLTLSQKRAAAVREALVGLGVPAQRLVVLGFGESEPVVANNDEASRTQNRRVQIFRKV